MCVGNGFHIALAQWFVTCHVNKQHLSDNWVWDNTYIHSRVIRIYHIKMRDGYMIYDFIIRQVLDDTIIPQITCVGMILRGGEGERERERDRGRERVGGEGLRSSSETFKFDCVANDNALRSGCGHKTGRNR